MKLQATAKMTDREFQRFSSYIYDQVGIQLPVAKRTMLEGRLQKRLKILTLDSFEEYGRYVFSPEGQRDELIHLIDVVTTNKTDFFREPTHFEHLVKFVLPEVARHRQCSQSEPFRIWSAGCSSGEEPYTMAMVLNEFAESHRGFRYSILASDISTRILEAAKTGIYQEDRAANIVPYLQKKYLLRSRDRDRHLVRICPELRAQVRFRRINFMDATFGINEHMDVIFCRNVIIYFNKTTQQELMHKFHRMLRPGGYLFLGHSETLNGLDAEFVTVASTVYRKI